MIHFFHSFLSRGRTLHRGTPTYFYILIFNDTFAQKSI
nr:MAG TPA: hypothetical protein [Caudoviricetes sp.]